MIKKPKTPEQIADHEATKARKRNYKSAITKAQNIMKYTLEKQGLRIAELQMKLIKTKVQESLPVVKVGVVSLSRDEVIIAYEQAISDYKESLLVE